MQWPLPDGVIEETALLEDYKSFEVDTTRALPTGWIRQADGASDILYFTHESDDRYMAQFRHPIPLNEAPPLTLALP